MCSIDDSPASKGTMYPDGKFVSHNPSISFVSSVNDTPGMGTRQLLLNRASVLAKETTTPFGWYGTVGVAETKRRLTESDRTSCSTECVDGWFHRRCDELMRVNRMLKKSPGPVLMDKT